MKKLITLLLSVLLTVGCAFGLTACNNDDTFKVGLICLHDDNSTYDKNFIDAFKAACSAKGVEYIIKTGIDESSDCYDAAADLVDQGCDLIFANSFGHEDFVIQAANEFRGVQFFHATGTKAHTENLNNYHNAFAQIYEGRYLAGVVAGLKLAEMEDSLAANKLDEDGNIKVGYVGAFPYAEVVSGYTSWYLGVNKGLALGGSEKEATMEVIYTSSWYDETAEKTAAETLISNGAALISQHADSWGAPTACEAAGIPNVSYNGSTASRCPNTFLVSSRINWQPYYEYIIDAVKNNKRIEHDWANGFGTGWGDGSVALTELGENVAEGTEAIINDLMSQIKAGTLKVFDCSTFTVKGETVTTYLADVDDMGDFVGETEVIKTENGITYFAESFYRSAPYFDLRIDGIKELS